MTHKVYRNYRRTEPDKLFVGAKSGMLHMSRWFGPAPVEQASRVRVWPMMVLVVVVGLFLFGRLAQLTLVEGSYRRSLADDNRIIAIRRTANRGVFIDRNNVPMVRNEPVYKKQVEGTTVAQQRFEAISQEEAMKLAYGGDNRVFFDVDRDYVCNEACAIVLGYMGEVDQVTLERSGGMYQLGDTLGMAGLEKAYEMDLRGVPGSELLEVNASGMLVREVGRDYPEPGVDIPLTLDMGLQQVLYTALAGRKGAVVAQVPDTGEVLAMVSSPAYNPASVSAALTSSDQPFFNRAISGVYPPGSVFKLVTAVAGLEEGKIDGTSLIEDSGELVVGQYRYGNWYYDDYGRTEGEVDVVKALRRSNDIFFYRLGEMVGANTLAEWARNFGYEQAGGLDFLGASTGTIPDPMWKERVKGERWFLGNTYHMAIGQGDVLVSPLQVNRMTSAVAASGVLCPAYLRLSGMEGQSCTQLNLDQRTVDLVQQGMKEACEPGGTAYPLFGFEPHAACKTGTAQQGGVDHLPHAWFTVYAPLHDPKIALTVLVEEAGQGSDVAAPVAKEGLEYFFHGDTSLDYKGLGIVKEE